MELDNVTSIELYRFLRVYSDIAKAAAAPVCNCER
jgi:hypothetical protein